MALGVTETQDLVPSGLSQEEHFWPSQRVVDAFLQYTALNSKFSQRFEKICTSYF